MITLDEQDLIFDFSFAKNAEKFDDIAIHGSQSSMKKVDFIVETDSEIFFIEVKDPDVPGASNPDSFFENFKGGSIIPEFAGKYRDSFLFKYFQAGYNLPIKYVVLVSMTRLDTALLITRTDALKSSIPISHNSWRSTSVDSCIILNLDQYKRQFGVNSVWRKSECR